MPKLLRYLTCAMLLALFIAWQTASAGSLPVPPEKEKCPVCGMFVAKYPNWAGTIEFNDGTHAAFDGPKDLFIYYLNLGKYNHAKTVKDITAIRVKDYYTLAAIDGRTAYYVAGSDVYGPMGKELVPFAKLSDARGFMNDHRGKRIVRLKGITPALLDSLE